VRFLVYARGHVVLRRFCARHVFVGFPSRARFPAAHGGGGAAGTGCRRDSNFARRCRPQGTTVSITRPRWRGGGQRVLFSDTTPPFVRPPRPPTIDGRAHAQPGETRRPTAKTREESGGNNKTTPLSRRTECVRGEKTFNGAHGVWHVCTGHGRPLWGRGRRRGARGVQTSAARS